MAYAKPTVAALHSEFLGKIEDPIMPITIIVGHPIAIVYPDLHLE